MTERRFTEAEVAAIFERAAQFQQTTPHLAPPGEGMTLADLQEIGREVGIPGDLVARAAQSLETGRREAPRRFLGLPLGVGRTVDLGRRLSDEEWDRLVVDLRETFDARGTVRSEGSFRQWTNGNLQALLEPTAEGHRIRLRTLNGSSRSLMTMGLGMLGITAVFLVTSTLTGAQGNAGSVAGLLSGLGLGMFGLGAVRLPRWARLRRAQMEGVAARLTGTKPRPLAVAPPEDPA